MDQPQQKHDLPGLIFGLNHFQHKLVNIKHFLKNRNEPFGSKAKKHDLLKILSIIEQNMFEGERNEVTEWFIVSEEIDRTGQVLKQVFGKIEEEGIPFLRYDPGEDQPDSQVQSNKRKIEPENDGIRDFPTRTGRDQARRKKIKAESQADFPEIEEFQAHATNKSSHSRSRTQKREYMKKECSVCLEVFGKDGFPEADLTNDCNHLSSVCSRCVAMSINTQIPDVSYNHVRCPECPSNLPYEVIKKYASIEAFTIFEKKSLLASFADIPNFMWCLDPKCGSGQIHDGGENEPIVTCETCSLKMCFVHKKIWHEGLSCDQYDIEREVDVSQIKDSEAFIKKAAKVCPNPHCGIPIIKQSGCDHMICTSCYHEFCFVCRASWKKILQESNEAHEPECKYHTSNLPATRVHPAVRRAALAAREALSRAYADQSVTAIEEQHVEEVRRVRAPRLILNMPARVPRTPGEQPQRIQTLLGSPNDAPSSLAQAHAVVVDQSQEIEYLPGRRKTENHLRSGFTPKAATTKKEARKLEEKLIKSDLAPESESKPTHQSRPRPEPVTPNRTPTNRLIIDLVTPPRALAIRQRTTIAMRNATPPTPTPKPRIRKAREVIVIDD